MKHRLLLFIVALFGFISQTATAQEREGLVVETTFGQKAVFYFDEDPQMTFSGTDLVVETTSEIINYPMKDVIQVLLSNTKSGIEELAAGDTSFNFHNGTLTAEGLTPGAEIFVFAPDGTMRMRERADENGRVVLNTEQLAAGVYIVNAEQITYKFIKR